MDFSTFNDIQSCILAYNALSVNTINEELKDSEKRSADRMVGNGHGWYNSEFMSKFGAPGVSDRFVNGRATIPITLNQNHTEPHPEVKSFLSDNGYNIKSPEDYKRGTVHKTEMVGNPEKGIPMREKTREFSIGKVLEKHGASDVVKKAFANDPARASSTKNDFDFVLSHHPHDVYGMSTGRGWTSCAQLRKGEKGYGGPASQEMAGEINNHTHVGYLVPRGGNVDTDAIARLNFKHHTSISSGHQTLIPETIVYGTAPNDFHKTASDIVSSMFPHSKREVYLKHPDVYNDNGKVLHTESDSVEPAHLDKAWKAVPKKQQSKLYANVIPGEKYKSKKLNDMSKILKAGTTHTGDFVADVNHMNDHAYLADEDQERSLFKHGEKLEANANEVAKSFNPNDETHIQAMSSMYKDSEFRRHIHRAVRSKFSTGEVRTPEEFGTAMKMHRLFGQYPTDKINIADDHKLGHDGMRTLMDHGVVHDHDTFEKAYFSLANKNLTHGNLYDTAARMDREGAPNANHVIHGVLAKFSRNYNHPGSFNGKSMEMRRAEVYDLMHPENRQIFADHVGENADEVMAKHRPHLNELNEKYNTIMKGNA